MKLSNYFLPVQKDAPKEAEIPSHKYMLRAGMIKQTVSGICVWLPLGLKILHKISNIIREEMARAGALEILMPTIQSAELWKTSGRYNAYGPELLRFKDRHERELLYGPTNEEMIADLAASYFQSYKDLPKNVFHIQWKFRDEIRPRYGVMRGREFLMKDNYSFDLNRNDAIYSYHKMYATYLRIFSRLGLRAIPMKADTGPIGGDFSHEFMVMADTGESTVFYDKAWENRNLDPKDIDYEDRGALASYFDSMTEVYAATDEKHDFSLPSENFIEKKGIEVGHIFYFGTKYSDTMGAQVQDKDGKLISLEMGSYGIGVSRLMGALIESGYDDKGIIWPKSVAPFDIVLIGLSLRKDDVKNLCDDVYQKFQNAGFDVLYDDTDNGAGAKFGTADLIGIPYQAIIGPKGIENGDIEIKDRKTGSSQAMNLEAAIEFLKNQF